VHGRHRPRQLQGEVVGFEQIAAHAGGDGGADEGLVGVLGEEDDRRLRLRLPQRRQCRQCREPLPTGPPRLLRHVEVQDEHVRRVLRRQRQHLLPGGPFPHHRHSRGFRQRAADGAAHQRVVVDDQIHRGLRRVWDEGDHDLVVLGASRHGILGGRPARGTAGKLHRGKPRPVVAIVRAEAPIRNRFRSLSEGAVERFVPQIDRENRITLVDRVQSSSNWDFDFFALMLLSTVIAGIGLIQSSAAVVIGAMLVAPLMTPLLGLGLALVQGNPVLAKISLRAVLLGLAVSLLVGFLTGALTPGFDEPTREMLGRGGPGILDLLVAFASGLAAAYASSRPGLLAALPGVAIAAALVPPIATAGLALSLGNMPLAVGALVLFTVNMVTIVLATVVAFWVVGLRRVGTTSRWVMSALAAVLLSVLALGVYLSLRPDNVPREQQIPSALRFAMQERLGDDYRLTSIAIAYDELGAQLNVRIVGNELAPEEVADDIRRLARDHFDAPIRVRLISEIDAGVESIRQHRNPPP